jgi:hypothetical protein
MTRTRAAAASLLAALAATALAAAQDLTKADAASLERKIQTIMQRSTVPPPKAPAKPLAPLRTSLTEREVNAYFKFNMDQFPPGVVNPLLTFSDAGRLAAKATVDLEAVRKSRPRGALDPMNLVALAGSVDLLVNGTLKSKAGMGTLIIESASLGGIPIPVVALQEIILFYTKTPELPQGFDITKPFPLPVGIREVQTQRGAAIVVQ